MAPVQTDPIRRIRPAIISTGDHVGAYFVILNRAAARYQQGVDVSTQLAESFVRHDSHGAVRDKRAVREVVTISME